MDISKVFYNGKCIMTVDMDYVNDDSMYEYLEEILGMLKERAFEEFDLQHKYDVEAQKVWIGNEDIYDFMRQTEQLLEANANNDLSNQDEQELEGNMFAIIDAISKKADPLFDIMQKQLTPDKFEQFKKLRREEIQSYSNLEVDFYAGKGCLDYVWVERNGRKKTRFFG